ncbi:MAG TPA: PQQ-dependent sugar dehydrogenase [Gammaproteobacteria bacterium]|nr:PQQ-dependent sugar dehydrogenase [Gammaproteobacteria bacterium]
MHPLHTLAVVAALAAAPAAAQRPSLPLPPLPDEPFEVQTAEMNIRVVVLARDLENPWSLVFLPDGSLLITENGGRLRLMQNGELRPDPVPGVPAVRTGFLSGLFDIKLHPDFASNNWVYLTYSKPVGEDDAALAVARGVFDGEALTEVEDIFVADDGTNSVSRMLFGPDGKLYVSGYGAGGQASQEPGLLGGKILRLNDDGSVPDDNPFVGRAGYRPEVFTMGHRSPESLVIHEPTAKIWQGEMGPNGGDEVNILEPGGNYGWPLVSLGRSYAGPYQPDKFHREGMIDPVVSWIPSISTTGITFYTGDRFPAWQGNLFVGGVRYGEIAGTGRMQRIVFNENMQELRRESLLADFGHRIREVKQGPDGLLYVLTDHADGVLLRIEPAE